MPARRVLLAESAQSLPLLIAEDHPYDQLVRAVAAYYGTEVSMLLSVSRQQPFAIVRQIIMHLMERVLEMSRSEIARVLLNCLELDKRSAKEDSLGSLVIDWLTILFSF